MNDSRPTDRFNVPRPGSGPQCPWYAPPADPAYADQAPPYAPAYGGQTPPWAPAPNPMNATRQLPAYWQHDLPPSFDEPPPPGSAPPAGGPKSPRWLWIAAGAAILLVVALVVALVLADNAIKTQTAVPPLPPMPESSSAPPTPSFRTPPPIPAPLPPTNGSPTPTGTTGPAAMQDVVYNVNGEGRAISIMYIDTDGLIQTEFNVALPWSKEVNLSKAAVHPANVTVVNIGHNVTCSVTVDGVQVSRRVGVGLTICDTKF